MTCRKVKVKEQRNRNSSVIMKVLHGNTSFKCVIVVDIPIYGELKVRSGRRNVIISDVEQRLKFYELITALRRI